MDKKEQTIELPQEEQDLINKFKRISSEDALLGFEKKNREAILNSSLFLQNEFNQLYKKITGKAYLQPITAQGVFREKDPTEEPLHPKATNYRQKKHFAQVEFVKHERTKRHRNYQYTEQIKEYDLWGITSDGDKDLIELNVTPDAMPNFIGKDISASIIKSKEKQGRVECDKELWVIGYWYVIFAPAGQKHDTEDVQLSHQGACLQIQRNIKVPLPGTYLEVADAGRFPVYKQNPESLDESKQGRKIIGWVMFYPYTVLGVATKQAFESVKASGDRIAKKLRSEEKGE